MTRTTRQRTQRAVSPMLIAALLLGMALASAGAEAASALEGADDSAATITAKEFDKDVANAPLPDLKVTVSQTRNLQDQGIQISWTGGLPSTLPTGGSGGENFLQIMQCWGEDKLHPGQPDRTTCQYGGLGTRGSLRDSTRVDGSVADEDEIYTVPETDFAHPTYTSIPFRSATGVTIASIVDKKQVDVDVNTNQFFTRLTTNEISWAGSGGEGSGSAKFEMQTAARSPGLGCGAPITEADGKVSGQPCWLVIVPRGTKDRGERSIVSSGLFWDSWKHHLAFKLDFKPIGVRCTIGAAERQLAGSELVSLAVNSWQPSLCGAAGGAAYTLINLPESDALAAANGKETQPLALTTRPLATGGKDIMSYAPIALTGVAVTFAIDRSPGSSADVPADVAAKAQLPFSELNLTPRLVAKLLTNSYLDSLPAYADKTHVGYVDIDHPGKNARNLTSDKDFLAVNDEEWKYQVLTSPSIGDLLAPQGRSDSAMALWSYVLADPEAKAFLAGEPDPWGMVVNPWSSTNPEVNPSGTGLELPRDDFPKADPIEQAASPTGAGPVNLVTWRPYTNDLDTAAYLTLRGDGQLLGGWDNLSTPPKYGKESRKVAGFQAVLGLSDTASAARYQVVTASLLNPAGTFVPPTTTSLVAAANAMTPEPTQPQVVTFSPESTQAKTAPDAYPLAMPVYAATSPSLADKVVRDDYAAFIRYAANDGQTPGTDVGQLPPGYAPLPAAWVAQAMSAAAAISAGPVETPNATSPGAASTPASTTSAPAAALPPAVSSDPDPTGDPAGVLAGSTTPDDPGIGLSGAILPLVVVAILGAGLVIPLISRRRKLL